MRSPSRLFVLTLLAAGGLAACATTVATTPHPLLSSRRVVAVAQPADSSLQRQARQLLIRGLTYARLGDTERALEFYRQALSVAPDAPVVLSAVAEGYEAEGDPASALLYAERAVDLAPENAAYWIQWSELLVADGRHEALATTLGAMVSRFPDDPSVLRTAILGYLNSDRVNDALPLASRLARLDAGTLPWPELLPHLSADRHGDLYEQALLRRIDAEPTAPDAYARLGRFYLENDRPEEALSILEAGLLQADGTASLTELVVDAREIAGVDAAGPATPSDRLAQAHRLVRDAPTPEELSAARSLVAEALAAAPDRVEAQILAGRLAFDAGAYAAAAEHLQQALQRNPRDVALWELAARAHLEGGDASSAVETADEALLLFPGQPPLLVLRARAHLALDHPAQAAADARAALDALGADADSDLADRARRLIEQAGTGHANQ